MRFVYKKDMDCILTLVISPPGAGGVIIEPSGKFIKPGQLCYLYGTVLTLKALAHISGARFDHWEGHVTGTTNNTTLTMDSSKSVTAVFTVPPETVIVDLVTSVMGKGSIEPSSGTYIAKTQIMLVATPDIGNVFVSWSGDTDSCSFVPGRPNSLIAFMSKRRHIIATFQVETHKQELTNNLAATLYDAPFPKERDSDPRYTSAIDLRRVFYSFYDVSDPAWWDANVQIRIDPAYKGAASSINDIVTINPSFARPCILAHEFCHSVYSKLTPTQKQLFSTLLPGAVASNYLIELAIKDYGNSASWTNVNIFEAHAQIYRYFGRKMPVMLYEFYPHLV